MLRGKKLDGIKGDSVMRVLNGQKEETRRKIAALSPKLIQNVKKEVWDFVSSLRVKYSLKAGKMANPYKF